MSYRRTWDLLEMFSQWVGGGVGGGGGGFFFQAEDGIRDKAT